MRNGQMVEQDVASKYSLTSTICRPAASATARTRDVLPLPGAPVTKKEDWIAKELAIGVVISRSRVRSRSACLSSNGAGGDAARTPTKSAVWFQTKAKITHICPSIPCLLPGPPHASHPASTISLFLDSPSNQARQL
jgi:hypothetical protein